MTANDGDQLSLSKKPNKKNPDLIVAIAQMQERSGKLEAAEKQYQKALKIQPNIWEPWLATHAYTTSVATWTRRRSFINVRSPPIRTTPRSKTTWASAITVAE